MNIIKTKIPEFHIRIAEETDTPLILRFIKELAEYEKLLSEVTATEETLKSNLFKERKAAEVLLAYYKEIPVGFAVFFHNFSTFLGKPGIYLEDIFISPEYRGKGFGKIVLSYLAKLAVERGCGRFEWWVLDWNKNAITFYRQIGAKSMDEWTVQRVTGKELFKLANEF